MCGRYTLRTSGRKVGDHFGVEFSEIKLRFNIAPTQLAPAVRASGSGREAAMLRWGLIPSWAKDAKIGYSLINARSETAATKPAFRSAFQKRRCLLPADGFYEWQTLGKKKMPMHFHLHSDALFAFAGLWERWAPADGEPIESCTILTTTANSLVAAYHDRMPVILPPASYDRWLDPAAVDVGDLLAPYSAEAMAATPANPIVNSPRNEGPACLIVE